MSRILALFMLFALVSTIHAAVTPTLDGRSFTIDLVEEAGGKAEGTGKDTLRFADGFGDCGHASKSYGYAKGMYKVMKGKNKDQMLFRFTMTSAEHGELLFAGTVQGRTITGTRTWSKPNKPAIVHRFTGQQQ